MSVSESAMASKAMWRPMDTNTNIDSFRHRINQTFGLKLSSYWDLYDWSVHNYGHFWQHFSAFSNIVYLTEHDLVVDANERIDQIPKWFIGAKLNYTQNIFERKDNECDNKIALYIAGESKGHVKSITFAEMRTRVEALVAAMRRLPIAVGDRVAGYLPNGRDAIEAFLATSAIGAIWSSTSPDFGVSGVLERLRQIKPKLIFSVDGVIYNGKYHNNLDKLSQIIESLDCVEKVVVSQLECSNKELSIEKSEKLNSIKKCCTLQEFIADQSESPINYYSAPFDHPLCILFSSGTTGEPKCLAHSVGGTLIQHLKEHILHGNMNSNDIIMYYTTVCNFKFYDMNLNFLWKLMIKNKKY